MIIKCCVCKKVIDQKEPLADKRITHTYCNACVKKNDVVINSHEKYLSLDVHFKLENYTVYKDGENYKMILPISLHRQLVDIKGISWLYCKDAKGKEYLVIEKEG